MTERRQRLQWARELFRQAANVSDARYRYELEATAWTHLFVWAGMPV